MGQGCVYNNGCHILSRIHVTGIRMQKLGSEEVGLSVRTKGLVESKYLKCQVRMGDGDGRGSQVEIARTGLVQEKAQGKDHETVRFI